MRVIDFGKPITHTHTQRKRTKGGGGKKEAKRKRNGERKKIIFGKCLPIGRLTVSQDVG